VTSASKQVSVVISRDGPYIVSGDAALSEEIIAANTGGESIKWQRGKAYDSPAKYALCRCGRSSKAPFCDGTHARAGFNGTETAPRTPYAAQAFVFDGPDLRLWTRGTFVRMRASKMLNQQFSKDSDLSRGVVPRWSENEDPSFRERIAIH